MSTTTPETTVPATRATPFTPVVQEPPKLATLLKQPVYRGRLEAILRDRTPQFVSALLQIGSDFKMKTVEPRSILAAGMTAAALDLPIDKNLGFAHIVPYKDRAQFQMGYKGFVQLGLRSGQYRHLNATEVYEGELVSHDRIKGEVIIDTSKRTGDKITHYAAYLQLLNGYEHAVIWTTEEVEKHAAKFSQAYKNKKKDSPWFTAFPAMAKKTVLKSLLSHWGPMSVQLQTALVEDQGIKRGPDAEVEYPDNEKEKVTKPDFGETKAQEDQDDVNWDDTPTNETQAAAEPTQAPAEAAKADEQKLPTVTREDIDDDGLGGTYGDLRFLMQRDGISEEELLVFARRKKLATEKQTKLRELSSAKWIQIIQGWDVASNQIKIDRKAPAEEPKAP